jgi:hypothetical protein
MGKGGRVRFLISVGIGRQRRERAKEEVQEGDKTKSRGFFFDLLFWF